MFFIIYLITFLVIYRLLIRYYNNKEYYHNKGNFYKNVKKQQL